VRSVSEDLASRKKPRRSEFLHVPAKAPIPIRVVCRNGVQRVQRARESNDENKHRDENDKQRAPAARLWRRWDLGLLRPCDGPEGMSCSAGAGVGCSESIGD
jgi:hypothetical protein